MNPARKSTACCSSGPSASIRRIEPSVASSNIICMGLFPSNLSPRRDRFMTVISDWNPEAISTKRITGRACKPSLFDTLASLNILASILESAPFRGMVRLLPNLLARRDYRPALGFTLRIVRFPDEVHHGLARVRLTQKPPEVFSLKVTKNSFHCRQVVLRRA